MGTSGIRTQVRLARRRALEQEEKRIREGHFCPPQPLSPDKTNSLILPGDVMRTLLKEPSRAHSSYAIIDIGENFQHVVLLSEDCSSHDRVRIILFGRISVGFCDVIIESGWKLGG